MLPELHLFTVLYTISSNLLVRAPTSDSRNVRVIQFAPLLTENLLVRRPSSGQHQTKTRTRPPRLPMPQLFKPSYRDSRIFYQWATWPRPRTLFLPPRFSKLLENSRRFYPVGYTTKRTEFPSRLHATRSFYQEVIYLPGQGWMPVYLPSECNDLSDPLLACHNKWPVQRTVTPPERLIFLTFQLIHYVQNNKIYLWRRRTVTNYSKVHCSIPLLIVDIHSLYRLDMSM
jgi:hypothetical protein